MLALEGVSEHCLAYARLASEMAKRMTEGQSAERQNLMQISERMTRLAEAAPQTLVEAAQLVFTLHSCLHHVGEPTAVGRLDQMLQPFYEADLAAGRLGEEEAQEIIDSFWIKIGEKVQLNRQFVEDHQPFGNLAMGGASGNYPQGSSLNQWIQQVSVGGTIADDAPGAGRPAYNDVTRLCLRAARRLPLNAPCLSLRTREDMPAEIVREAALAILSGGAHPILLSDAKITPGLQQSGDHVGGTAVEEKAKGRWQSRVTLRDARDYASDGCYEPQLAGTSWFTLGGITSTLPLEAALNQGKAWQSAGPVWFRGQKVSFTSEPAREIDSFDRLLELYFKHLRWMYAKQADGQIGLFGRMNAVCPAPLLSMFIDDCIDKGLDYYEGGARYNVIAPCFTGLSTLVDSLWAISRMVFDTQNAVTSLPELVDALRCNWGENMAEPFISTLEGPVRIGARAERFRRLRQVAMSLPKFGRGNADIDQFGDTIIGQIAGTAVEVFTNPVERTAEKMLDLAQRLGTPEHPFGGFQIQPGVGSFENYLDWGNMSGASADGRLSGDPLASDASPAPSYGDQPIDHRLAPPHPRDGGLCRTGHRSDVGRRSLGFQYPRRLPGRRAGARHHRVRTGARLLGHDRHLRQPRNVRARTGRSGEVRSPARTHGRLDRVLRRDVPRASIAAPAAAAQHTGGSVVASAYLVESIPKGLEDLRSTPGVQYTEDVLVRLAQRRKISIDLTAMYWACCPIRSDDEKGFDPDDSRRWARATGKALFTTRSMPRPGAE